MELVSKCVVRNLSSIVFVCLLSYSHVAHCADRLSCYQCTYTDIESDTTVIGSILDVLTSASNDHCKFENLDEDITEVGRIYCEEPGPKEENKCVVINGEAKGTFDIKIAEIDFKYKTITRDCVTVRKDESEYANGCRDHVPSSGPVRDVFKNTLEGYELGNVEFKGTVCYDTKLTTTSTANPCVHICSILIMAALVVYRLFL